MRFKYISAICSIFTAIGLNAMTASTDTVLHATGVDVLISENAEGLRNLRFIIRSHFHRSFP